MTDGKMTDAILRGRGGGELSHAGSRTRTPIVATAYTMETFVKTDGSGSFVIHHGGVNMEYPFNSEQRKEIIKGFGGIVLL